MLIIPTITHCFSERLFDRGVQPGGVLIDPLEVGDRGRGGASPRLHSPAAFGPLALDFRLHLQCDRAGPEVLPGHKAVAPERAVTIYLITSKFERHVSYPGGPCPCQ